MLVRSFFVLAALVSLTTADVEFVTPSAGSTVAGGKTLSVTWKESGVQPPLSSFTTYTLFLCAGGNDVQSQVWNRIHTRVAVDQKTSWRLMTTLNV